MRYHDSTAKSGIAKDQHGPSNAARISSSPQEVRHPSYRLLVGYEILIVAPADYVRNEEIFL